MIREKIDGLDQTLVELEDELGAFFACHKSIVDRLISTILAETHRIRFQSDIDPNVSAHTIANTLGHLAVIMDDFAGEGSGHQGSINGIRLGFVDGLRKLSAAPPIETHSKSDPAVRQAVLNLTNGLCAYCDVDLVDGGQAANSFVVEHVVPASKGGPDHLSNYVPACCSCNTSKRDGHVLEFIKRRRNVVPLSRRMTGEAAE